MHGVVWEWCSDWYDAYPDSPATDPTDPTSGVKRVFRGGAWRYGAAYCRSASRYCSLPTYGFNRVGFRLVLRTCDASKRAEIEARKETRRKTRQAEAPVRREPTPKKPENPARVETPDAPDYTRIAGAPLRTSINGAECVFRYCPPGKFLMGSPDNEEGRVDVEVRRNVALTQGFWALETPVTQALWKAITGANPSEFVGDSLPVECVSWEDVVDFVWNLNEGGFAPKGLKFDLPTEAEWEYACRAGASTPYNFGNEINPKAANYDFGVGRTSPMKTYPPNAWGLYDAHGNVNEWCSDRYGGYLLTDVVDPLGAAGGAKRVIRGGSWNFLPRYCRSASRRCEAPTLRNGMIGFRLILRELAGSLTSKKEGEGETERAPSSGTSSNADSFPTPSIPRLAKTTELETDEAKLRAFMRGDYRAIRAGASLTLPIKGVESLFRYCPPGTFLMGSPEREVDRRWDETQHKVTLTKGYWLLETPVTQRLWRKVTGNNPSYFKGFFKGLNLPVESVSRVDCLKFISKMNDARFAPTGTKFDFPTEAEWEYACRAGTTTPFNFGSTLNGDKATYSGYRRVFLYGHESSYKLRTTAVQKYAPNAWGFYDMHGNVFEWCKDWYDDYPEDSVTNPTGAASGSDRVKRGGSWHSVAGDCRSASRSHYSPSDCRSSIGFRLALRSAE